ncbi:MAG: hypothetical protein CL908_18025 [Deltaproteobacteria bacterium]|nr:hypothetical protein [Deltaproteobacteria bacterium]
MAAEVSPLDSQDSSEPAANGIDHGQAGFAAAEDNDNSISTEFSPDSCGSPAPNDLSSEPPRRVSPNDSADFLLHPVELAKGRTAAENYLSTFRSEDTRRGAEEALETLATVISGGKCDSVEFPWQQVRPYHGAAALTILKERGAPARIEALRCRKDTTRSYRVVPDAYPTRQVQKIRSTLSKVIAECNELGFLSEEDRRASKPVVKGTAKTSVRNKTASSASRGRLLGDGELRALIAACAADGNAEGARDSVLFALTYRGLKIAEITGLTPDSVRFSNKTGVCTIVARPKNGGKGRRVELTNNELICLEDWIDYRGNDDGPLLSVVGRGNKVESKRLTIAILTEICEKRAKQAQVDPFVPNDLSRGAEALIEHRKAAKRKANRLAQETLSAAEQVLYDGEPAPNSDGERIRFPFLGLHI